MKSLFKSIFSTNAKRVEADGTETDVTLHVVDKSELENSIFAPEDAQVEPQCGIVKPVVEIGETRNGLTVGLAYVLDIAGSSGLLWITSFSKSGKYAWCLGFDFYGEFKDMPELYDISVANFVLAEKSYIEKRIEAYETDLKNRALYSASGSDVKYMQGGFYAGTRGKKTFFVVKDNRNLTYDIVTIDKANKEVRSTVFFDKTTRQLTKQQASAYVKKQAVKRGFTRKELSFGLHKHEGLVLSGFDNLLIWRNGFWEVTTISRMEAVELLNYNYVIA